MTKRKAARTRCPRNACRGCVCDGLQLDPETQRQHLFMQIGVGEALSEFDEAGFAMGEGEYAAERDFAPALVGVFGIEGDRVLARIFDQAHGDGAPRVAEFLTPADAQRWLPDAPFARNGLVESEIDARASCLHRTPRHAQREAGAAGFAVGIDARAAGVDA